ncbi:MAG: hypothetical protein NZ703_14155 [Gemmataceae bacterium]|nr:hypothetical protein [Gemmataceae bacterium]MCS7272221.1 hypothetical protein [Gemmataceae bacterium]MDW8244452.1 hypothetical protein [Thermogemmata sp.]
MNPSTFSRGVLLVIPLTGWLVLGCGGPSSVDEPLPTDGPNQVVLKVPRMT